MLLIMPILFIKASGKYIQKVPELFDTILIVYEFFIALNNWPFSLFKRRHFYSWHHESGCEVLLQGASFNLILECLDCEALLQGASQPRLRDDLLISKHSSIFMAILDSRAIICLFQNYWSQNYNFIMPRFWNSNFFIS